LRLINFVFHSILGLRAIQKKQRHSDEIRAQSSARTGGGWGLGFRDRGLGQEGRV